MSNAGNRNGHEQPRQGPKLGRMGATVLPIVPKGRKLGSTTAVAVSLVPTGTKAR
ncbi:MAG: hypothetical protein IKO75_06855 [Bacteroidales bacterium]|nr:hypothetical protein [Bacteroidales bacterium]